MYFLQYWIYGTIYSHGSKLYEEIKTALHSQGMVHMPMNHVAWFMAWLKHVIKNMTCLKHAIESMAWFKYSWNLPHGSWHVWNLQLKLWHNWLAQKLIINYLFFICVKHRFTVFVELEELTEGPIWLLLRYEEQEYFHYLEAKQWEINIF